MRRLSIAALTAVPLLLIAAVGKVNANPAPYNGFGCGDFCLGLFKNIHQHGPLFNYGPYYGYYPFTPYGPWDPYLRYNPFYYGDPYANWVPWNERKPQQGNGNMYGRNPHLRGLPGLGHAGLFHRHGHGFFHASWLHGGWFRGHEWLHGSHALFHPLSVFHKKGCATCGSGDVSTLTSGFGTAGQSAVFYPSALTLDPTVAVASSTGEVK